MSDDIHPEAMANIHTLVLERARFHAQTYISGDLLRSIKTSTDPNSIIDLMANDLVAVAMEFLAPGLHREDGRIEVPTSWWEHIKKRLGWKFHSRTIVMTTWHICPHLPHCDQKTHVEWLYAAKDGIYPLR